MDAPRILFALPDIATPSEGVRQAWRMVELLTSEGIDAAVWHYGTGFRPGWIESSAPVVHGAELELDEDHLLVVPEVLVLHGHDPAPGGRTAILNQSPISTYDNIAPSDDYPGWSSRPAVWSSSAVAVELLQRMLPDLEVSHLPYWIDTTRFHARGHGVHRRIAFFGGSQPPDATLVVSLLERHASAEGWEIVRIDELDESATAEVLGTSDIFLTFGEQEALPLKACEAMASECLVVGYGTALGNELVDRRWWSVVEQGDVAAFVDVTAALLDALERDERRHDRAAARHFLVNRYRRSVAASRLVELVETACKASAVAGVRATHPLNVLARNRPPASAELHAAVEEVSEQNRRLVEIVESIPELRRRLGHATASEQALRDEIDAMRTALSDHNRQQVELAELAFRLRTQDDALHQRIHDLEHSTSWRATQPLRWVSGLIRGTEVE